MEGDEFTTAQIVEKLRWRSCPAGEPWTGDNPEEYHGHTDCWLYHLAARRLEVLEELLTEYGRHAEGCSAAHNDMLGLGEKPYRCRCGWDQEQSVAFGGPEG